MYDLCFSNKWVNGSQMTVIWHVDDLNISHAYPEEFTELINYMDNIYGNMALQRRKQLNYIGMELDYRNEDKFIVTMNSYIKKTLEEFPEEDWNPASSPSRNHLFKDNKDGRPLDEKCALLSHHLNANLLFISKQEHHDI